MVAVQRPQGRTGKHCRDCFGTVPGCVTQPWGKRERSAELPWPLLIRPLLPLALRSPVLLLLLLVLLLLEEELQGRA